MVMGRATFEKVLSFGIEWPYIIPVFVLSNTLKHVEDTYKDKVYLLKGPVQEVLEQIHQKGFHRLYIDGGRVIQDFLRADMIDEMVITTIPVLLGEGIPLFGSLVESMVFECVETKHYIGKVVQSLFRRRR